MVSAGARVGEVFIGHDDEGNAVGERPILVGSGVVKLQAACEEFRRGWDDASVAVALRGSDKGCYPPLRAGSGEGIGNFGEHPCCRDDGPQEGRGEGVHAGMVQIGPVEQRHEIGTCMGSLIVSFTTMAVMLMAAG